MPADTADDIWGWIDDLTVGDEGTPGPTPRSLGYIKKLGRSTKRAIARSESRVEAKIDDRVGGVEATMTAHALVMADMPRDVAAAVAALTFDQAYQEREAEKQERIAEQTERKQSRDAKVKLARYFLDRFFDVANTLVGNWWFAILLGIALVLASAGIFAGQTGLTFNFRDGIEINPGGNEEKHPRLEDHIEEGESVP